MANYEKKIFYVTQEQYDILKNDGTVGSYTGIDSDATYFVRPIPDNYELFWNHDENQIQLLKNGDGSGDSITIQYASYAANAGLLENYSSSDFVNVSEEQTITGSKTFSSIVSGSISGNAGTATKLFAPVKINGVNFDGSANIIVKPPVSVASDNKNYPIIFSTSGTTPAYRDLMLVNGGLTPTINPSTGAITAPTVKVTKKLQVGALNIEETNDYIEIWVS